MLHDSRICAISGLYFPLRSNKYTQPGFAILGDSAFPRVGANLDGKIVQRRKTNELANSRSAISSTYLAAVEKIMGRAMPSERNSAEWGINFIKQPFGHLSIRLPGDTTKSGGF